MNEKQRKLKVSNAFYSIKRLHQHLFHSTSFAIWSDKISAINQTSYEDLGGQADQQLYKAKATGRGGFSIE